MSERGLSGPAQEAPGAEVVSERREPRIRSRSEGGFVALELAAGVALLVLPVVLLVASLPQWSDRQSTARLAARDAARRVTLAGWCDTAAAHDAAIRAAREAGLGAGGLSVTVDCDPGSSLPRGGTVTARVTVVMPAVAVPLIGVVAGWSWTAGHTEPVDPYASLP